MNSSACASSSHAVRGRRSNFCPVVANASDLVVDELRVLVAARGDVLMLCTLDEYGKTNQQRLVGELGPKQRLTFDLVQQRGETGAAELMREFGESEKTTFQTAWNNRLAALAPLHQNLEPVDLELSNERSLAGNDALKVRRARRRIGLRLSHRRQQGSKQ